MPKKNSFLITGHSPCDPNRVRPSPSRRLRPRESGLWIHSLGFSSASSTADWTQDTGTRNCWYTAALAAVPTFVWRDNVFMRPVTSEALLASGADTRSEEH